MGEKYVDQQLDDHYKKVDHRYQESKHYLDHQLRYAAGVQEFRSVKQALLNSTQFNVVRRSMQFARVAIPVKTQQ